MGTHFQYYIFSIDYCNCDCIFHNRLISHIYKGNFLFFSFAIKTQFKLQLWNVKPHIEDIRKWP